MRVFAVPKSIAISCVKKLKRPISFYVKENFNLRRQSWWKLFELTTANSLFFNILQNTLHWTILTKNLYLQILLNFKAMEIVYFVLYAPKRKN